MAKGESLWELIRSRQPETLAAAALNPHLTEDMAMYILKGNTAPAETVTVLGQRFKGPYKIKLAVANHTNTPLKVALSMLKHLRIFDLADITRNHFVKAELRKKVELMLEERLTALASGIKITLVRHASPELVARIMEKSEPNVIAACLDSPLMTEERIYKLLVKPNARVHIVRAVAAHPRWSLRYDIRMALVRSFHTPMQRVVELIAHLRTVDLELLHQSSTLPAATRPFIFHELGVRSCRPVPHEESPLERHEIPEDADEGLF